MSRSPGSVVYPSELPITEMRDELLDTIRDSQVVIVAGETGSGKSTQLPKMCIDLGLHETGWIGHTQPRRIAARSIAERVAEELGGELGGLVGYKVRFTDKVSPNTAIKLMTDGVLLAEMQHDRQLSRYSTIIVDEAHERSLNIDFLLGYMNQLLARRADLKLIVTSATIDTERFSEHFGNAPIVEVSGRTYPVELRYRPIDSTGGEHEVVGQADAIAAAVRELDGEGDILVFCSGEREIRDATETIAAGGFRSTEVVPLYGRLSAAEQHRVFDTNRTGRRIVVATNVAETSLTVPGIRCVIDAGTARISRYSSRTKVQRLPIEAVSRASANQRAGRCGRLGPGICVRLYSEDDFEARPEFTEPEITRTNLASVILQMASLGLGEVEKFPFLDPPELRNIRDGVALLEELDAVDPDYAGSKRWLTPIGRQLARLPLDPRFARMVIDASDNACLREVIVITAGLSIVDPRERPSERRAEADKLHGRFDEPNSDFLGWLKLWEHVETERKALSGNQFRKLCRREFLNHNRIREWQDIVRQLQRTVRSLRLNENVDAAESDTIHQSLLTGLLSHIGMKDSTGNEFLGGRQARFLIGRSSVLAKKPPNWVIAGELVETNRLWAHTAARINPEWAERAGAHIVKRSYEDPEWDRDSGSAMTIERISLYGVPLVAGRNVHYRQVDPERARELFIHHALIEGDWDTHHAFFAQNEDTLDEVRQLGARKRQDLFVEYDVLFDFFDERLGPDVTSGADFDHWWDQTRIEAPKLFDLTLADIFDAESVAVDDESFPDRWQAGDVELAVDYEFATASPADGVTVVVPLELLGHVDPKAFEWNVPGLREELVTALLRSMPKAARKVFVPIPDTVAAIMPGLIESDGNLIESVRRELRRLSGDDLPADALAVDRLPDHLRPSFRVVGIDGEVLAFGRDLETLRAGLAEELRAGLAKANHELVAARQTRWTFGELPQRISTTAGGQQVDAFPALVDEGTTVGVALFADREAQYESMWSGTRRLLRLNVGGAARLLDELLDNQSTLAIASSPHGSKVAWVSDAADCIFSRLLEESGGPVWSESGWNTLADLVRQSVPDAVSRLGPPMVEILVLAAALRAALTSAASLALSGAQRDMLDQLDRLVYPNHLSSVGPDRVVDVVRYLRGIRVRLDKLPDRVEQDSRMMGTCRALEAEFEGFAEQLEPSVELEQINWLLEEFRIATFAQQVGVGEKVSEKRIRTMLGQL